MRKFVALVLLVACTRPPSSQGVDLDDDTGRDKTAGIVDSIASTLTVDRVSGVIADGVDQAVVSVHLVSLEGEPLEGTPVSLESNSSACTFTPQTSPTNSTGDTTSLLRCTASGRVNVRAVADPGGLRTVLFQSADIDFAASSVTQYVVRVIGEPAERERFDVEIEARDAFGQVVLADASTIVVGVGEDASDSGVNLHGRASVTLANGRGRLIGLWFDRAGTFSLHASAVGPDSDTLHSFSPEITVAAAPFTARNRGLDGGVVVSLAADPSVQGLYYASTITNAGYSTGVGTGHAFVSHDGGRSWRSIVEGLDAEYQVSFITSRGLRAREVYAVQGIHGIPGLGGGLFHSLDAGASWTKVNDMLSDNVYVASDGTIYEVGYYPGSHLYASRDGGITLDDVGEGLPEFDRYFDITPASFGELNGKVMLWTVADGLDGDGFPIDVPALFQREEAGWTAVDFIGLPSELTVTDETMLMSGNALVVSAGNHIYCSTDGSVFVLCEQGITGSIESMPTPGEVLFARADGVIYRTTDPVAGWQRVGVASARTAVVSQASNPAIAVARGDYTEDYGLYRSTDGGLSYASSNLGLHGSSVFGIRTLSYMGGEVVVAFTAEHAYRSTNQGASWTRVLDLDGRIPLDLELLPDETILGLFRGSGPSTPRWYRSSPDASSFTAQTNATIGTIAQFAVDTSTEPARLIVSNYGAAYSTTLNGTGEVDLGAPAGFQQVAAGPSGYAFLVASGVNYGDPLYVQTHLVGAGYAAETHDLYRGLAEWFSFATPLGFGGGPSGPSLFVTFSSGALELVVPGSPVASSVYATLPLAQPITRIEAGGTIGFFPARLIAAGRLYKHAPYAGIGEPTLYVLGDDSEDFGRVHDFAVSKAPDASKVYVGTRGGVYFGAH